MAEAASVASAATRDDTAITIYSSAEAGAIPLELTARCRAEACPTAWPSWPARWCATTGRSGLEAGRSTLRFSDVAGLIDPTTVTFTRLTDPGTRVLEQNFQFDLVSNDKLLQKFIDRPVTVERAVGNQGLEVTLSARRCRPPTAGAAWRRWLDPRAARPFVGEVPGAAGGLTTQPTLVQRRAPASRRRGSPTRPVA